MGRQATVFVGNIPYDTTEEQLKAVFSQVGSVSSFRLVYDPNTGKPKGYGFCEYEDPETAMSALRNLNNVEVNGRALRVDLAEHDKSRVQEQTGQSIPSTKPPPVAQSTQPVAPTPGGGEGRPGTAKPSMRLDRMSPEKIYEIMVDMKELVKKKPEEVQKLLMGDPSLTYSLLQGQVMLGMVPPQALQAAAAGPHPTKGGPFDAGARQSPPVPGAAPVGGVPGAAVPPTFPVIPSQGQGANVLATPPVGLEQLALIQQLSQNQGDQLQMVMQLTPAQIEQLPPADRQLVMQLQRTVRMVGSTPTPPY